MHHQLQSRSRDRIMVLAGALGGLLIGIIIMLVLWPTPKLTVRPAPAEMAELAQPVESIVRKSEDPWRFGSGEKRNAVPPFADDPDPEAESIPDEASRVEADHASGSTADVPAEAKDLPIGSDGGTRRVNDRDGGRKRRNRLVVEDPLPLEDAMPPEPSNRGDDQEDSKRKPPKLSPAVMEEIRALIAELKDANGEFRLALKQASEKRPPTGNFGASRRSRAEQAAWESRVRGAIKNATERAEEVFGLASDLRTMAFLAPKQQSASWVSGLGCQLLADFDPDIWIYGVQRLLEDNPLDDPTSKPEFEALLASKIPSADVACLERLVKRLTEFTTVLRGIEQQLSVAASNLGMFNVLLDKIEFKLPLASQLKILSEDLPGFQGVDTLPQWMNTWRRIWNQVLKKKESQSQSGGN